MQLPSKCKTKGKMEKEWIIDFWETLTSERQAEQIWPTSNEMGKEDVTVSMQKLKKLQRT